MKNEWRDLFNLSPILLYKADLFDLEKILSTVANGINSEFRIQLTNKNQTIEVSSVQQLFACPDLPSHTDEISINVLNWKKEGSDSQNIVGGVYLTLHHNYVSCQIHSEDEEWFIGKKEKLKRFFATKKPWYSVITRGAPFILPVLIIIPLQNLVSSLVRGEYPRAIISFICLFIFSILGYFSCRMLLFPYVRIVLKERNKSRVNVQLICAVIGAISAVFVIIDYISKWFVFKK